MVELHSIEEKLLWIIPSIRHIEQLLRPCTDCPTALNDDGMVNVVDLLEGIGNGV